MVNFFIGFNLKKKVHDHIIAYHIIASSPLILPICVVYFHTNNITWDLEEAAQTSGTGLTALMHNWCNQYAAAYEQYSEGAFGASRRWSKDNASAFFVRLDFWLDMRRPLVFPLPEGMCFLLFFTYF